MRSWPDLWGTRLRRHPDGEWVFLELNPNGQWGWIELATGLPIASAIATRLSKEHT